MSKADEKQFEQMRRALQDYNISLLPLPELTEVPSGEPTVWELVDREAPLHNKTSEDLLELAPSLSFEVRYQLEVCVSHGVLNEHSLTEEFVSKLLSLDTESAQNILEYLASQKKRVFDPMSIFDLQVSTSSSRGNIPDYCTLTRSVTVTPTTLYFNTPTVEISNRIIRQYPMYADRFIRVRFTDEKLEVNEQIV